MVMQIADKRMPINHIPGPLGVRGRVSDNRVIKERLGWEPSMPLVEGIERTYRWIEEQVKSD
jgi:nucleoside-diphosphate-sugar epimerase